MMLAHAIQNSKGKAWESFQTHSTNVPGLEGARAPDDTFQRWVSAHAKAQPRKSQSFTLGMFFLRIFPRVLQFAGSCG